MADALEPDGPRIAVTPNGPYRLEGHVALRDARGEDVTGESRVFLCRCGQSQSKPFCDGSHKRVGFVGTEVADHGRMEDRRDTYEGDGIVLYDDRARCAHAGACTGGLPAVWKLGEEPWIDPLGASADEIAAVVARCPSGALTYARPGDTATVEEPATPAVTAAPNGPYRVAASVPVVSADGEPYEVRARQTLCRCGQSKNKPFCDGSHWYAEFRDPA